MRLPACRNRVSHSALSHSPKSNGCLNAWLVQMLGWRTALLVLADILGIITSILFMTNGQK
jgi:hypothetical protein